MIDKKAQKRLWIALFCSIPFLFFVLYYERGQIGKIELIAAGSTILIGTGLVLFLIKYSNK
jgi:hypothetical protein